MDHKRDTGRWIVPKGAGPISNGLDALALPCAKLGKKPAYPKADISSRSRWPYYDTTKGLSGGLTPRRVIAQVLSDGVCGTSRHELPRGRRPHAPLDAPRKKQQNWCRT